MEWQQALANLKAATGRTCIKQGKVITVYSSNGPYRIGVLDDGHVNIDQYNAVLKDLLPKIPDPVKPKISELKPGDTIRDLDSGVLFTVVATDGKRVQAVALYEVTKPEGWELVG